MGNPNAFPSIELVTKPADGERQSWVHILPAGTFNGVDGRGPYHANDPEAIAQASRRYSGKRKMVVDFEHQSILTGKNGKPAPAAGWITGMRSGPDGVWALVEWTENAWAHIQRKEYRYLSPVVAHEASGNVTHIVNVALTNQPNIDTLTALSRSEETAMNQRDMQRIAELAKLFGLPDGSTADQVAASLRQFLTGLDGEDPVKAAPDAAQSAEPDLSKFVPIGDFERVVSELNTLRNGVSRQSAEIHVSDQIRAGKLPPYLSEWGIALCTRDKPAFDTFVERTGPAMAPFFQPQSAQLKTHKSGSSSLDQDEQNICRLMGLSDTEFAKARGTK